MVDRMPSLTEYLPDLKRYLLEYPKASLPKEESFLYWQNAKFGLKPTIRINHLTIAGAADSCRRGFEDAVREPLLLDSHRIARDGPRRRAGRGFLVCHRKPEPI